MVKSDLFKTWVLSLKFINKSVLIDITKIKNWGEYNKQPNLNLNLNLELENFMVWLHVEG